MNNLPLASHHEPNFPGTRKLTEAKPYVYPEIPLGTWRINDLTETPWGRPLEILREVDPQTLLFKCERFPKIVQLYTRWIAAGHEPPPIRVTDDGPRWQNPEGIFEVDDGHHRTQAARAAKLPVIRAWARFSVVTGRTLENGWPEVAVLTAELAEQRPDLTSFVKNYCFLVGQGV